MTELSKNAVVTALSAVFSIYLCLHFRKRDFFYFIFISFLVLYSLPSQVGYMLVPDLSSLVGMYFGETAGTQGAIFTGLSFLSLALFRKSVYSSIAQSAELSTVPFRKYTDIAVMAASVHLTLLSSLFIYFFDDISYQLASDEEHLESLGPLFSIFVYLFKLSTFINIANYNVARWKIISNTRKRATFYLIALLQVFLFIAISAKFGNRTDPLALTIAIVCMELGGSTSSIRKNDGSMKATSKAGRALSAKTLKVFGVICFVGVVIALLSLLQITRNNSGESVRQTPENLFGVSPFLVAVLFQDYYSPYHVLLGAMANNFVAPLTVIQSNVANSVVFLKVPYLQEYIVNYFNPGTVTRTASPAMFLFAEGYVFAGWLGVIYNGVVISACLGFWRLLTNFRQPEVSSLMTTMCVAMAANVARSQTSYFIKDLPLWFIPAYVYYSLFIGAKPWAIRFRKKPI